MPTNEFPGLKSFNPKKAIGWWFFKKSLLLVIRRGFLLLSAAAAGIGIWLWVRRLAIEPRNYALAGSAIGALIMFLALVSLLKFKATVLRAFFMILLSAAYLAGSVYYIFYRS